MLSSLITYLNTLLDATGLFEKQYGITELVTKNDKTFPGEWCQDKGGYTSVSEIDKYDGVSYWRIDGDIDTENVESEIRVNSDIIRTYPLRLVCIVRRNLLGANNTAYAYDKLSASVQKVFKDKQVAVRKEINAKGVTIEFGSVTHSVSTISEEEFAGVDQPITSDYVAVSMEIEIGIRLTKNCISDFCDSLTAPTSLSVAQTASSLDLTWTDNATGETGYHIYRSISPNGSFVKIANTSANSTTYSDTDVVSGTTYYYRVRAYTSDSVSSFSNVAGGQIQLSVCADGSVTLNGGDTIASDVPSGGVKDISVHDSSGSDVGSTAGGGIVTVADGSATLGDGGDEITPVKASETVAITIERDSVDITGDCTTDGAGKVVVPTAIILNTANPIKTGQTTSYATGDDGDLQEGRLTDFTTLDFTNVFGNTNRFTDELGGQDYVTGIVIDHATTNFANNEILGWHYLDFTTRGAVDWPTAVSNARAFTIGSFTSGWFLPNINQVGYLLQYNPDLNRTFNYPPFNETSNLRIWTSTTRPDSTGFAIRVEQIVIADTTSRLKTQSTESTWMPVRIFTWSGSSLI